LTVSNLENLLDNNHQPIKGKQVAQVQPFRTALGDIRNKKSRTASAPSEQKAAVKAKPKPIAQPPAPLLAPVASHDEEVEHMEVVAADDIHIEDIDKEDVGNPQLVVEYVQDIYGYMRQLEAELPVKIDYLGGQQVILPKMRAVLIDWLVSVHIQFKLLPETVYTAVSILDRFMQVHTGSVSRASLQLVGVTAMFIASKYEEIYAPEVKDFVYITDKAYTEKDIMRMELKILNGIGFKLGKPLPLHFLRRASKAGGVEAVTHTLAKYIMELSLKEYSMASEYPSKLAAAALALSIRLLEPGLTNMKEVWSDVLVYYTRYTLPALLPTIQTLASVLLTAPTSKLSSVYQKYANKKFMKISRIPALDDPVLKRIADGKMD